MATPRYDVVLTSTAEQDLALIHAEISEHSRSDADRFVNGLVEHAESLETFPGRGGRARERRVARMVVRQLIYRRYRVLYLVLGSTVFVVRVGHGARRSLPPNG